MWRSSQAVPRCTFCASLAIFQVRETSRGVPLHDLAARVQRLVREAAEWRQKNP